MFRRSTLVFLCATWLASAAHADGLRDPMQPAGTPPAAPRALSIETLRLEGVIGNGGQQILLEDPSGNPIELFQPA